MQTDILANKCRAIVVKPTPSHNVVNGSIVAYEGTHYFCYRAETYPYCYNPRLIFCDLDLNSMVATNPRDIRMNTNTWGWNVEWLAKIENPYYHHEDPRLYIGSNGELRLSFTDGFKCYDAQLEIHENYILCQHVAPVYTEYYPSEDGRVKNLTPLSNYHKSEYIYSIKPFRLSQPNPDSDLECVDDDLGFWIKKYGEPRGGTPAIPYRDDSYLTFFHSSKEHNGFKIYVMGALVFSEDIGIEQISRSPLVVPIPENKSINHDGSVSVNPCGEKVSVVFPTGVIKVDDGYLVSFGYNDRCTKVCFISDEQLKYNLIWVNKIEKDDSEPMATNNIITY